MLSNKIIVRVDGGFCSQLSFYALGYELMQRGHTVEFDLGWYEQSGKDKNGEFDRSFVLTNVLPALPFTRATSKESRHYRIFHPRKTTDHATFKPPLYIDGYPSRQDLFLKYSRLLRDNFKIDLDETNARTLKAIMSTASCGVHARRGDLSRATIGYGEPTSAEYFLRAIRIVACLVPNIHFFFFSDEPSWLRTEILPKLPGTNYTICEDNKSDKGHVDLYLMSHCKHFITSIGSMGIYAAALGASDDSIVVMSRRRDLFFKAFKNVIYLNDDTSDPVVENVPRRNFFRSFCYETPLIRRFYYWLTRRK